MFTIWYITYIDLSGWATEASLEKMLEEKLNCFTKQIERKPMFNDPDFSSEKSSTKIHPPLHGNYRQPTTKLAYVSSSQNIRALEIIVLVLNVHV